MAPGDVIDYHDKDWPDHVRALTGHHGVEPYRHETVIDHDLAVVAMAVQVDGIVGRHRSAWLEYLVSGGLWRHWGCGHIVQKVSCEVRRLSGTNHSSATAPYSE